MELYNVFNMPLSNDNERRKIQEKQLLGEELTLQEKLKAGGVNVKYFCRFLVKKIVGFW